MLTATFRYGVLYLFMAVKLYQVLVLSKPLIRWHIMQVFFSQVGAIFQIHINYSYYTGVWKSWSLEVVNFQSFEMQFSHLSRSSSLTYRSHPFLQSCVQGIDTFFFYLWINTHCMKLGLVLNHYFVLRLISIFFSPMINKCWVKSIAFFLF